MYCIRVFMHIVTHNRRRIVVVSAYTDIALARNIQHQKATIIKGIF